MIISLCLDCHIYFYDCQVIFLWFKKKHLIIDFHALRLKVWVLEKGKANKKYVHKIIENSKIK